MFLLLTAAGFLTHNDVYEQSINIKQLNICPKTYNRKNWSAAITYYPNHDVTNYLYLVISKTLDLTVVIDLEIKRMKM